MSHSSQHGMSPADVVRTVIGALEERRWDDVAPYVDPVILRREYESALESARTAGRAQPMTADDFLRHEPDMPPEVAEYYARRAARSAENSPPALAHIGLQTVEELAALTPAQYLAAKLRAHYTADAMWELVPPEARFYREAFEELSGQRRREVLGEVVHGQLAFVVYREQWGGEKGGMPYLAALRQEDERWLLQGGGELFGEGSSLSIGFDESAAYRPRPLAVRQAPWTSRTFEHRLDVELFPAVLERFRSAPARAAEIALGVLPSVRTAKPDGRWSIQEHLGHLLDLETLGERRLEDYRRRTEMLAPADMSNRATHEAAHNDSPVWQITESFEAARKRLADALAELPADILAHRAMHPRLGREMNVVEWVFFMCEHDDHHLAVMRAQGADLTSAI